MSSVLPQLSKSPVGLVSLAFRGAGLSAALALIASSTGAIAASNPTGAMRSQQPMEIAQSTNQAPDVIIDPTPQNSGSTTTPSSGTNNTPLSQVRFSCEQANGQYTVMYHPQSQPNQSFAWATPSSMGSEWSPERRCNEISRRLETYRPDGLVELRTATVNNYNTVCVTTEKDSSCRIVFTVPPGQDPVATRDRVFQNLTVADSGQVTQGVYTYTARQGDGTFNQILNSLGLGRGKNTTASRSQYINLKPFLDYADGGTGTQLSQLRKKQGSATPANGRRLNPRNF